MSGPHHAVRAFCCPRCEDEQVYGVTMTHTIGGLRCPRCGTVVAARSMPRDVDPFAAREEAREIREVWREETSRDGCWVRPDATGGEGTGARKPPVNPYARGLARRGS